MNIKRGFANVLSLVLLSAFGIAATAMLVKTATDTNTKTDLRSRASENVVVDGRWDFKKDMGSWTGTGWQRLAVDPKAGVLIGQPSTSSISMLTQTNSREKQAGEVVWNGRQKRTAIIRFVVAPLKIKATPRMMPMGKPVTKKNVDNTRATSMTVTSSIASVSEPLVAQPSTTFSVSLIHAGTKKVYTTVPVQMGSRAMDYRIALNALEDVRIRDLGFQFSSYATPVEVRIEEIRFEHVKTPTESVRDITVEGTLSADKRGNDKPLIQTSAGVIYALNGVDMSCTKALSGLLGKTVCVSGKVTDQMQKTLMKKDYPSIVIRDCRTDVLAGSCPAPTKVVEKPTPVLMTTPTVCTRLPACAYQTSGDTGTERSNMPICKIAATPPDGGVWCPREPVPSCKGYQDGVACTNSRCPVVDCPEGKRCPQIACAVALGTCSNSECVVGDLKPTSTIRPGCREVETQCVQAPCPKQLQCVGAVAQ